MSYSGRGDHTSAMYVNSIELDEATAKLLETGRNVSEVAESFETIGHSLQRQQRQREANILFQLVGISCISQLTQIKPII